MKRYIQDVLMDFLKRWPEWTIGIGLAILFILLTSCSAQPTSFDPGIQAAKDQMTSDAYDSQAQLNWLIASVTAEAPILAITQRAAELNFQQTQSSMSLTQIAASWTATPSPIPTSTPTPTPNYEATRENLSLVTIQTQTTMDLEAQESSNNFWVMVRTLTFAVIVLGIAFRFITYSRERRRKPIARDEHGKPQPIIDIVSGRYVDQDANPNYFDMDQSILAQLFIHWLKTKHGFQPNMPAITAERQDRVKERQQIIQIETIRHLRLPKAKIDSEVMKFIPEQIDERDSDSDRYPELPLPSWVELNKWDGDLLPIGNDEQAQLIRLDTSQRPHLMYVGKSRSGKTLTGERTSVACLLTQGWNVIVMGKRVDWMPFTDHPNFKLLAVDVRKDAQKYIDILQVLSAQMDIRDELLASKHISTWDRYGAPSTMVVLDDYSGALLRMPRPKANEVIAEVRDIAMDGAKFGLSLTIGLQDAIAQNIDTTTRSQMARIVYSLDNAVKSRVALDAKGAELLPPFRHFLTRITDDSNVGRGVGFFLEDRQVEAFLASRPVAQNDEMEWVDGIVSNVPPQLPLQNSPLLSTPAQPGMSKVEFVNRLHEWEVKALDLYEENLSQEDIVAAVFDASEAATIGKAAVADLIARWRAVKNIVPVEAPTPEPVETKEERKQKMIAQLAESIRAQWTPELGKTRVSKLLKKDYAGTSWVATVDAVIEYLKSTTTTSISYENGRNQPLETVLGQ